MGLIFAAVALFIAAWQLHLQRMEIRQGNEIKERSNHLERLRTAAELVKTEVELRGKIIADKKAKNADWDAAIEPHIAKVNRTLRPSFGNIQLETIKLHGGDISELRELPRHLYQANGETPYDISAR